MIEWLSNIQTIVKSYNDIQNTNVNKNFAINHATRGAIWKGNSDCGNQNYIPNSKILKILKKKNCIGIEIVLKIPKISKIFQKKIQNYIF